MADNERLYLIGLTMLKGVGDVLARALLQYAGTAEEVFKAKRRTLEKVPGIGEHTARQIEESKASALQCAEKELAFADKNKIRLFALTDKDYPKRLRECQDAPAAFYYKGNADLDAAKVLSVVGTRRLTDYGRELTESLIKGLAGFFPDIVIVSGLAYGIDVCAHRAALKCNLPTIGVLAHGLDRIYPSTHRNTAAEMLKAGGLLTDFPSGTNPDRENFLRRNRLIAGLADATVIVESAEKGGALITADIAFSYGRDVYTFPGRVNDEFSKGCNRLIQKNKAGLISSADDLIMSLCWDADAKDAARQQPIKFGPEKPNAKPRKPADNPIVRFLEENGEFQVNDLASAMDLPIHKLSPMLFELEMSGFIKSLPGGIYRLA